MSTEPSRHRIRLRGQWTQCPGESVCYRRQFNCPSGLSSHTQLFFLFQDCVGLESTALNQTPLQLEQLDDGLLRAKIGQLMPGANQIDLHFRSDAGQDRRRIGQVWLEIVEPN